VAQQGVCVECGGVCGWGWGEGPEGVEWRRADVAQQGVCGGWEGGVQGLERHAWGGGTQDGWQGVAWKGAKAV